MFYTGFVGGDVKDIKLLYDNNDTGEVIMVVCLKREKPTIPLDQWSHPRPTKYIGLTRADEVFVRAVCICYGQVALQLVIIGT